MDIYISDVQSDGSHPMSMGPSEFESIFEEKFGSRPRNLEDALITIIKSIDSDNIDTKECTYEGNGADLLQEFYNYCMDEHDGMLREEFIYLFLNQKT